MSGTMSAPPAAMVTPAPAELPFSRFAAWGFGLAFFVPLVGVILSHIGLASIVGGRTRGKALAIWGLVLNYLAIVLWPFAVALLIWLGFMFVMLIFGAPPESFPSPFEFWAPYWTGGEANW